MVQIDLICFDLVDLDFTKLVIFNFVRKKSLSLKLNISMKKRDNQLTFDIDFLKAYSIISYAIISDLS